MTTTVAQGSGCQEPFIFLHPKQAAVEHFDIASTKMKCYGQESKSDNTKKTS
jgi:hypothetical protein